MAFHFSDRHIVEYHAQGFTVFEGIVPVTLLGDLRREAARGREIARRKFGDSAQRLQPVAAHGLDTRVFTDFAQLPAITDALRRIIGPNVYYGGRADDPLRVLGILYEPREQPWCTQWHRDWRDNAGGLDLDAWHANLFDVEMFNQVNCALYEDSCTWVVPGSHYRRDTPAEIRRFPQRPIPGPALEGLSVEQREIACLEYCRSLPGAVQTHLSPGDFLLYRNSLWHLGNYVPYKQRATIHDIIGTPKYTAWFERPPMLKGPDGQVAGMQNANRDTPEYRQWEAGQTVAARV